MNEQLALFMDFENVAIWAAQESVEFDVTRLIAYLESRGAVVIKRAYADWSHFSRYREDLLSSSMDLTQVYNVNASGKKNRADMWMTVDALEAAIARPNIRTMVIVSGDSDFGPLVSKLREYGRFVIGIGPQNGSHHLLIKACDEFVYLDHILGSGQVSELTPEQQAAHQLLREAMGVFMQRGEIPVLATKLKQMILTMDASFNEADLGYRQFRLFLEDSSEFVRVYKKGLQIYVVPDSFIVPQELELESEPIEVSVQAEQDNVMFAPVKLEQTAPEPIRHPEPGVDLKALMFNNNPILLQTIKDVLSAEVDDGLWRDRKSADLLAKKGWAARFNDFNAAADYYLMASRLLWELVEQSPQDDDTRSTLLWTMASYASCRAAEISQVQKEYDAARPYYLSFFVLIGMLGSDGEQTKGLTNSMLKHYWWNVGRELDIAFEPALSPASFAIQAARHENSDCRQKWQEVTIELAMSNPDLLEQIAGQMRLNLEEAPEGLIVAQQIEQILGIQPSEPVITMVETLEQPAPDVPDQEIFAARGYVGTMKDIEQDANLRVLLDDIKTVYISEAIPASVQTARDLIQTAAGKRSSDLVAATQNSLMACRMMLDAVEKSEPDATIEELRWFMGEYAAAKGAGLSLVQRHYSGARSYYLAFFVLAHMGSLTWKKMNALVNPMLTQYWLDAGYELGLVPEKVDNPVDAAVNALAYSHKDYRLKWVQVTRVLVQANCELMRSFAAQMKQTGRAKERLVAIEIEKIIESQKQ